MCRTLRHVLWDQQLHERAGARSHRQTLVTANSAATGSSHDNALSMIVVHVVYKFVSKFFKLNVLFASKNLFQRILQGAILAPSAPVVPLLPPSGNKMVVNADNTAASSSTLSNPNTESSSIVNCSNIICHEREESLHNFELKCDDDVVTSRKKADVSINLDSVHPDSYRYVFVVGFPVCQPVHTCMGMESC